MSSFGIKNGQKASFAAWPKHRSQVCWFTCVPASATLPAAQQVWKGVFPSEENGKVTWVKWSRHHNLQASHPNPVWQERRPTEGKDCSREALIRYQLRHTEAENPQAQQHAEPNQTFLEKPTRRTATVVNGHLYTPPPHPSFQGSTAPSPASRLPLARWEKAPCEGRGSCRR